ncbi:protein of unknown function [uncultured Sphingopyxis sp.]|uniref:Uncharacterized protein n=1 Tax=uncultured Sphingopyxis sp. TaxID=310581 RepID=A0A1Y5PX32_9SPHN|nr:protein of unknown function [uncultured Sphingopyxis sp.]
MIISAGASFWACGGGFRVWRLWGGERTLPIFVIPAKAGTQCGISLRALWVPAFAGMTM